MFDAGTLGLVSGAVKSDMDTDWLVVAMVEELRRQPGEWVTFRQLASRIRGDADYADVVAAIADSRRDLFVTHADVRVKLRAEALGMGPAPPSTSPAAPHQAAARALREYARQLRVQRLRVLAVHPGQPVVERFVHGLEIDISDDDLKLTDDTPVELVAAQGHRTHGYIVGASRDEAILYAAFRNEVLPADLPATLEVSRSKPLHDIADRLARLNDTPVLVALLDRPDGGPAALPLRRPLIGGRLETTGLALGAPAVGSPGRW